MRQTEEEIIILRLSLIHICRHQANIQQTLIAELQKVIEVYPQTKFTINISGSAGMGIGERVGISFVQEVVAAVEVVKNVYPAAHTLIDLGGEDAKMVFFSEGRHPDIRMNGSCAGGTGAFIDQMASLMNITIEAVSYTHLCRCVANSPKI